MVLIGVVALIKDQKIDLFHVHKSMSEQVIKLVGNHDQNILFEQLLAPQLGIWVASTLLLAAVVATYAEIGVDLDRSCLLLDQVLRGSNEDHFFLLFELFFQLFLIF